MTSLNPGLSIRKVISFDRKEINPEEMELFVLKVNNKSPWDASKAYKLPSKELTYKT
jgi:hypothetical protein